MRHTVLALSKAARLEHQAGRSGDDTLIAYARALRSEAGQQASCMAAAQAHNIARGAAGKAHT